MASSGVVNSVRPQFEKKLEKTFAALSSYTAANISATYVEAEVQAIADALQTLITELKAIS